MDKKEVASSSDNTTSVSKPTCAIVEKISGSHFKLSELDEYCERSETFAKMFEAKVEFLSSAKNASAKLKSEYLIKNKINLTNFQSLLRAKNELYKYKCDLKAEYIQKEKLLSSRRLQYKKIISSYGSEWQKALRQYTSDRVAVELFNVQQENTLLEKEIEKLQKLTKRTRDQFSDFEKNIKEKSFKKVVEFAEEMVSYKTFRELQIKKREKAASPKKPAESSHFHFLRTTVLSDVKTLFDSKDNEVCFSAVDMSVFDEVSVPPENLENQNEEELFSLLQNDSKRVTKTDNERQLISEKRKLEDFQDSLSNYERKNLKDHSEICLNEQSSRKSVRMNENESHYFQSQEFIQLSKQKHIENLEMSEYKNDNRENINEEELKGILKSVEVARDLKVSSNVGKSEERSTKKQSTEYDLKKVLNEENPTDAFENQFGSGIQNLENKPILPWEEEENSENGHSVTSQVSSGASAEMNESLGSLGQPPMDYQITSVFPESKTAVDEGFKPFGGFFSMEAEQKPSIFKLF